MFVNILFQELYISVRFSRIPFKNILRSPNILFILCFHAQRDLVLSRHPFSLGGVILFSHHLCHFRDPALLLVNDLNSYKN